MHKLRYSLKAVKALADSLLSAGHGIHRGEESLDIPYGSVQDLAAIKKLVIAANLPPTISWQVDETSKLLSIFDSRV